MAIIPFLVLFSLLIFVHEGGHFLMAKLFGVGVPEFGFGYPPRVWGKKIGETIYSINLIPFGGFARVKGMDTEGPESKDSDSFAVQSKTKRVLILFGGIIGNLILAWIVFTVLHIIGNPVLAGKVLVEEVTPGLSAEAAGIVAGDHVLSYNGEKVETADALIALIDDGIGKSAVLEVETAGEVRTTTVIPIDDPSGVGGLIGVVLSTGVKYEKEPVWRAPFTALVEVGEDARLMVEILFKMLRDLFRGEPVDVGGPVAILALTETYIAYGLHIFLQFVALLSLNLVIVNLLPFPALDGGRSLFIAYEAIRGKRPSFRAEQAINSIGFALLIILMVLITIKDIRTFFWY